MKYQKVRLPSGLRVISIPMPSLESTTLTIWVRTGSRFESKRINGISHFLEHMVFKGSKKRSTARDISEEIDSFGGEVNAGTTKEWTNFYIKARNGVMDKAFDVLSDMIFAPLLKSEEIEREKGVILQEMAMYEDMPIAKIGDVFENLIYRESSLGWDIIGNKKTVESIKRDDFVKYRKKYYYPENILITVSGGIKREEISKLIGKYFSILKKTGKGLIKPKAEFKQSKPQVMLKNKKTDQAHLILGFRGDPMGSKDRYVESILSTVLGGGMSSRLFIEVRERRGLAYAIKTLSEHYLDNGYFGTYAGVKTEKIDEAIKVILDQYYGLSTKKLSIGKKEFKKAKEYLKGHLALGLEDARGVNGFFGLEELMLGKVRTPEDVYKAVDKVELNEVYELAEKFFKPEGLNLAVIGPYNNPKKFEKLLK